MSRALIIVKGDADKARAAHWCEIAPPGTRIEFKKAKRSVEQNDRMWAMLTDVASQLVWHDEKLTPADWKLVFLDALRRARNEESRTVQGIDGNSFVSLGKSSSDLTKEEMSDLMEIIAMFGAAHKVVFSDPAEKAA